jgi:hypothetical protein
MSVFGLLGCIAALTDAWFLIFQKNLSPSFEDGETS